MRNLFLALVLANLGFAAWHAWFSAKGASGARRLESATTIALLSEIPSARLLSEASREARAEGPARGTAETSDNADGEAAPVSASDPPSASTCLSLGPFRDVADSEALQRELEAAGFNVARRTHPGEVWLGHWVYIEDIETQSDANAIVANLREAGISEAYVIAETDGGSTVSLGVFSEAARAEQRLQQARNLGLVPVVSDRSRPAELYWLDVTLDEGEVVEIEAVQDELLSREFGEIGSCPSPDAE